MSTTTIAPDAAYQSNDGIAAEPARKPTKSAAFDLASIGITGAKVEKPRRLDEKVSALVFGGKGSGKTSLLGSISEVPEMSPVGILATEHGTSVLAETYPEVDVITVKEYETANAVIGAFVAGDTPWKTFCIDTFYKLQQLMKRDSDESGYGLWGYIADESEKIINALHETRAGNFVFTTHAERLQDDTGKILTVPTFLGKKSLIEVLKPIDEMYFLSARTDGTRTVQTRPNGRNEASTRAVKMPMELADPTWADLYAYYNNTAQAA